MALTWASTGCCSAAFVCQHFPRQRRPPGRRRWEGRWTRRCSELGEEVCALPGLNPDAARGNEDDEKNRKDQTVTANNARALGKAPIYAGFRLAERGGAKP